jgi:hypothetical protein
MLNDPTHHPIQLTFDIPNPDEIKAARGRLGLTQIDAARLVGLAVQEPSGTRGLTSRGWQSYELKNGGLIPGGTWALFLLVTDQHPDFRLVSRKDPK